MTAPPRLEHGSKTVATMTCRNCKYEWIPRRKKPRRCPHCYIQLVLPKRPKKATYTCPRPTCHYTWTPRRSPPAKCPRCQRIIDAAPRGRGRPKGSGSEPRWLKGQVAP